MNRDSISAIVTEALKAEPPQAFEAMSPDDQRRTEHLAAYHDMTVAQYLAQTVAATEAAIAEAADDDAARAIARSAFGR